MSAASVVDLPEPVGPVTSTRPRGRVANWATDIRNAQLFERPDAGRDDAERRADRAALLVAVDAEPGAAGQRVGEVELVVLVERLLLLLAHQAADGGDDLLGVPDAGAR